LSNGLKFAQSGHPAFRWKFQIFQIGAAPTFAVSDIICSLDHQKKIILPSANSYQFFQRRMYEYIQFLGENTFFSNPHYYILHKQQRWRDSNPGSSVLDAMPPGHVYIYVFKIYEFRSKYNDWCDDFSLLYF
jgi:hypothetical protein